MGVIQFRAGAHEEIIRLGCIEDHIDGLGSRTTDGSGWQTGMLIGVIGRINRQMAIEDALEFEITYGVLDGRAGLEQHAFVDTVEIEAGDQRHLAFVMTLAFDDRGDDSYLDGSETDGVSFGTPFVIPEAVILQLHAVEELFGRYIPIDLIGIGYEETTTCLFIEYVGRKESFVLQMLQEGEAIHLEMGRDLTGQVFAGTDEMIPRDTNGSLIAVFESLDQFAVTYLRRKTIMTFFGLVEDKKTHMQFEVSLRTDLVVFSQELKHGVHGRTGIDIITMFLVVDSAEVTYMPAIVLLADEDACDDGD